MCSAKQKTLIHNLNRGLIAAIGAMSTVLDGASMGDLLCCLSMLMWLMQPEFNAAEVKIFDRCKRCFNRDRIEQKVKTYY